MQKYRAALIKFLDEYYATGLVTPTTVDFKNADGSIVKDNKGNEMQGGVYALNICPDESKMPNLNKQVYYYVPSETDSETDKKTSLNMQVCLFDFSEVSDGFAFESLLYINALIEECRAK